MILIDFGGERSKIKVTIGKRLYNIVNKVEVKPLSAF